MRIWTLIIACAIANGFQEQPGSGVPFKVRVVNSITGGPIAGANVVIEDERGKVSGRTDAGGVFTGWEKSSGKRLVTVTRRGYRMTGNGVMGKVIEIQPGVEKATTVEMLPLGILAGRVLDQYGDPVHGAIVRTLSKLNLPGTGEFYDGRSSGTTDDRGEYRVAEVEPGKHYVAAEYSSQDQEPAPRSRLRWPETGGFVLFPDTTDISRAQQLEVAAGRTTRVDDLRLKVPRAVNISGHIKPVANDETVSLDLHRPGAHLGLSTFAIHGGRCNPDGTFSMDVLPGTYVLSASDQQTGKISPEVTIEARDQDLTDIELTLASGYDVTGRIHVDGPEVLDFSKVMFSFMGTPLKIGSDGTFSTHLFGPKAAYFLRGLPDDWYVKEFLIGGQRVSGRWFEVKPGTTEVSLTVSPHGAVVNVRLSSGGSLLDSAAYVLLLPDHGPVPDAESALSARPDGSGMLVVHGVPPGSYRVFSLDVANFGLLMRPDLLMEKYGRNVPTLSVSEGERKTIVVPLTEIRPE